MSTTVRRSDGGYATFPNRWVDAGYMTKAPGSVTQVYIFLCRWADNTSFSSTQPMSTIAKKTGLSEDVARKAVRILEAWDVLDREPQTGPSARNVWHLNELQKQAPDYPDKTAPKQITRVVKSQGSEKLGTYQPEDVNQPEESKENQPEESLMEMEKEFSVFWVMYPRREGKADARKAWGQVTKTLSLHEKADICGALAQQINNTWKNKDKQYIPMPATWLRGKRWEDEIAASGPAANVPPGVEPLPGEVWRQEGTLWKSACPDGRRRGWHPEYYGVLWDNFTYGNAGHREHRADVEAAKAKAEGGES